MKRFIFGFVAAGLLASILASCSTAKAEACRDTGGKGIQIQDKVVCEDLEGGFYTVAI